MLFCNRYNGREFGKLLNVKLKSDTSFKAREQCGRDTIFTYSKLQDPWQVIHTCAYLSSDHTGLTWLYMLAYIRIQNTYMPIIYMVRFTPMVDVLWPSDTIWRHWWGSTLSKVMDCCQAHPATTNDDLESVEFCGYHPRLIFQEVIKISIRKMYMYMCANCD